MPQKESEAVSEEFGSDQPTLENVYRVHEEGFKKTDSYTDQMNRKLKEITREKRSMDHHETSLEQDARQTRLAMKGDRRANTKACEHTEGAATAEHAMRGDNFLLAGLNPARRPTQPASA